MKLPPLLESVARERLVKTQQAGKGLACAVEVGEMWRLAVAHCKWAINPFTSPNPVDSHTLNRDIIHMLCGENSVLSVKVGSMHIYCCPLENLKPTRSQDTFSLTIRSSVTPIEPRRLVWVAARHVASISVRPPTTLAQM
jgi:hypothetical protein